MWINVSVREIIVYDGVLGGWPQNVCILQKRGIEHEALMFMHVIVSRRFCRSMSSFELRGLFNRGLLRLASEQNVQCDKFRNCRQELQAGTARRISCILSYPWQRCGEAAAAAAAAAAATAFQCPNARGRPGPRTSGGWAWPGGSRGSAPRGQCMLHVSQGPRRETPPPEIRFNRYNNNFELL